MEKNPYFLFQKYFLFFKNGQKKCPKMKNEKKIWKKERFTAYLKIKV
jgi:hypothetical protein